MSVGPAPDQMAYLTVLGPIVDVSGAYASLTKHATTIACAERASFAPDAVDPDTGELAMEPRTAAQVAADTALELLSGRNTGQPTWVEVHLLMTDRALSAPATRAGAWTNLPGSPATASSPHLPPEPGSPTLTPVWLRRLYTHPQTGELVGMDSKARCFTGQLRRLVILGVTTTEVPPECGGISYKE